MSHTKKFPQTDFQIQKLCFCSAPIESLFCLQRNTSGESAGGKFVLWYTLLLLAELFYKTHSSVIDGWMQSQKSPISRNFTNV